MLPREKVRPDVIYKNPAWQEVNALKCGRIYCVPEADLGRPGPGLIQGFKSLRRIVEEINQSKTREEHHENRQLTT